MHQRYFLILCVFYLTLLQGKSQVPNWEWARGTTGTVAGDNEGKKIKVGASGNIYVCGNFLDDSINFGPVTIYRQNFSTIGVSNFFIIKYDSVGNLKFAINLGTGYFDGLGFDLDLSENFYVTGFFYQDSAIVGATTLYNHNWNTSYEHHIFIAKFDSLGNSIWVKSNLNGGNSNSGGIIIDAAQNLYFTGYSSSDSITFDSITVHNTTPLQLFIAKFNSAGRIIWLKTASAGPNTSAVATDISTDPFCNIVITGRFPCQSIIFDSITIYNNHPPGWWDDIFIAKYDSTGRILWAKSQGGNNQNGDAGICVGTGSSGNVYMAGYYTPNSTFDTVQISGYGGFLVQYNSNGNLNWIKTVTGNNVYISGLSIDREGNAFIAGAFTDNFILLDSITIYNTHSNYITMPQCLFLAKYDSLGHVQWATKGIGIGVGRSVYADNFENLYLTGSFGRDSMILGTVPLNINNTYNTTFTAKSINSINIINEIITDMNQVVIYPNPATSTINVLVSKLKSKGFAISIYNILGEKIFAEDIKSNCFSYPEVLDISNFQNGIYFLEIKLDTEQRVIKFAKL